MEDVGNFLSEPPSETLKLNANELEVIANPALSHESDGAGIPKIIYGRLLSGKSINRAGLKTLFESLWQNKAGVRIDDYAEGIVTLAIETRAVKNRILKGQPWQFAGSYFIIIEADAMTQVTADSFQQIPFWVHVSGIPLGHLVKPYGEILGKEIANSMGDFIEFDPHYRSKFMRIRVGLDSTKPLLRGKLLSLDKRKDNIWISFQYERLSKFCYFCGHLDHIQKDCAALMEAIENGGSTTPQYNNSLKTAGLAYVNIPDANNFQKYDNKSIAQAALEASLRRSTVAIVDPNTKRMKADYISTPLKIACGKTDDKAGVCVRNDKPKEAAEGAKNNAMTTPKSGHKGVIGGSPNRKSASR